MACIILAGGQSKRMGSPKESLDFGGVTLLFRVGVIAAAVSSPVLVVGGKRDAIPPFAKWVEDAYPGEGPLGGLITGLRAAGNGVHLALACDMPFVQPGLLQLLLERCSGHDAAVPFVNGRRQTLCAAYSHNALPLLEQARLSGISALHTAVETVDNCPIAESDLRMVDPDLSSFFNINSAADLDEARERLGRNKTA